MSNLNYSIPHFKTPFLSCKYSQSSFSPTTYTVSSFHFSTVATYFSYIYYHNTIVIHICKFYFFPLFHLIIISPKPFQSITSVKKYFISCAFAGYLDIFSGLEYLSARNRTGNEIFFYASLFDPNKKWRHKLPPFFALLLINFKNISTIHLILEHHFSK